MADSKLENIMSAFEVKQLYEVKASDGQRYLCELLGSEKLSEMSLEKVPIISENKKSQSKKKLINSLTNKNLMPDILREVILNKVDPKFSPGWDQGCTATAIYTSYTLEAYKIIQKL